MSESHLLKVAGRHAAWHRDCEEIDYFFCPATCPSLRDTAKQPPTRLTQCPSPRDQISLSWFSLPLCKSGSANNKSQTLRFPSVMDATEGYLETSCVNFRSASTGARIIPRRCKARRTAPSSSARVGTAPCLTRWPSTTTTGACHPPYRSDSQRWVNQGFTSSSTGQSLYEESRCRTWDTAKSHSTQSLWIRRSHFCPAQRYTLIFTGARMILSSAWSNF